MKEAIVLVVVLIIIAALFLLRFDITVHSPIIVKLDRLTGETWVANSGTWMAIHHK